MKIKIVALALLSLCLPAFGQDNISVSSSKKIGVIEGLDKTSLAVSVNEVFFPGSKRRGFSIYLKCSDKTLGNISIKWGEVDGIVAALNEIKKADKSLVNFDDFSAFYRHSTGLSATKLTRQLDKKMVLNISCGEQSSVILDASKIDEVQSLLKQAKVLIIETEDKY